MSNELKDRFAAHLKNKVPDPVAELVIRPVWWANLVQKRQDTLWGNLKRAGELDFTAIRRFFIDFLADAIAYQPTPRERDLYDDIHRLMAVEAKQLASQAGPKAPLCVIAHSLGSVIASNYIWDCQNDKANKRLIPPKVKQAMGNTPVERGETFTLFYTMGSPLAAWSLRFKDFGTPIKVPSPKLKNHFPTLKDEWLNLYDKDDVLAYPIKGINAAYKQAVKKDQEVNVGGILSSWNPAAHTKYWKDNDVTKP